MSDPLANILKVLQQKPSIVCAIAVAGALFLASFKFVFLSACFTEAFCSSITYLLFIGIIYLMALSGMLFVAYELLSGLLEQRNKFIRERAKRQRALAHLTTEMTMGEIWLLQAQISKGQKVFVAEEHGAGVFALTNKGLLQQNQHITHNKWEYEIPEFVWKSAKLKDLLVHVNNNETYKNDQKAKA